MMCLCVSIPMQSVYVQSSGRAGYEVKMNCIFSSSICCSVTQSCPTLFNPLGYSMSGFPVLHYFLELAQTQIH